MQLVNIVLTRALSESLAPFPPVGWTEILERAEGVQRQNESLTDRHSLARFGGCCRVAVGEGEGSPCRRLATDARRRKLAPLFFTAPAVTRPPRSARAPSMALNTIHLTSARIGRRAIFRNNARLTGNRSQASKIRPIRYAFLSGPGSRLASKIGT
jgi:hypothetical protein